MIFILTGVIAAARLGAVESSAVPSTAAVTTGGAMVTMDGSIKPVPSGPQPTLPNGRMRPHITRATLQTAEQRAEMEFNVSLKLRNFAELESRLARGEIISPAEMAAKYLPLPADYNNTVNWLRQQGFAIEPESGGMMIFAHGTVAQVRDAFKVTFARVVAQDGEFSSAVTAPSVPAALAPALLGVNGLQPHLRKHPNLVHPDTISGSTPPYYPKAIATAYGANSLTQTGAGQTIAIVMDAFPKSTDLTTFWTACGIAQTTANVTNITVGSGPPTGSQADVTGYEEACLDVEWSSSIATAAKVRLYGVNSLSEADLDAAYQQIYADATTSPQLGLHIVSLSYGGSEGSPAQLQTDDALFAQLASAGITVFAASGDDGSTAGAESPASDPNVTGVGGTSITLNTTTGAATSETGWSGSGGGASAFFELPMWQSNLGQPAPVPFRTVPDVAAPADPNTGCLIVYNGVSTTVGGTSWGTPTWAGFCALFNQMRAGNGLTSLGLLNPKIYPLLGTANFRDITSGSNGSFAAVAGYDMVTGIGVPNVGTLAQTLSKSITPPPNAEVLTGQNAVFALPNTGAGETSFHWQRCPANSSMWSNLTDNATYNGSATATLTINSTTAVMDGDQFQCVIGLSAGGSTTTAPTALVVISEIYTTSTVAGQVGVLGTRNGTGTAAQLSYPNDPAVDSSGNIYVADFLNYSIRKITAAGAVSTFAGSNGNPGDRDGIAGAARFNYVNAVYIDSSGNLYVADSGNDQIRKVLASNGNVTTIAGESDITGTADGAGNVAQFNFPSGVAVDASGNIFVADTNNHLIRKITVSGGNYTVSTLAGTAGVAGFADGTGTSAKFNYPAAIAVDASGNLYVADAQNNAIRKVTQAGVVTTLAGHPPQAGLVDGTGSFAYFNFPSGITVDSTGNIYVTDTDNDTVRKITPAGVVTTVVGQPAVQGSTDGASTSAQFNTPYGLCVSSNGAIIIADTSNDLIRAAVRVFAPQIQTAPQSQAISAGQNATFSLAANGTATLNYAWQTFVTGNSTWTSLSNNSTFNGTTTAGLTINAVTLAMNGEQFRCLVSNAYGSAATGAAVLTVGQPPVFTTQPVSASATVGNAVQFIVAATGQPAPTYQWQLLPSGGSAWIPLTDNGTYTGSATSTLTVTAASVLDGAQFNCVAANGFNPNATSQAALLMVYPAGYVAWTASLNLTGASALPTATPFGDTLPNLMRFAMGIGATPTAGQLPALSTTVVNGVTYLRLDYNVSKSLSGLQVFVQYSYELQTWQTLSNADIAQLTNLNPQTTHYEASIAMPASGTVFLRLVVQPAQ